MTFGAYRLLAGLLLGSASTLPAQTPASSPVSLEQVLRRAAPASEALGLARAAATRADAEVTRARSELFPQLSGSASYNRLFKSQFEGLAGSAGGGGEPAPTACDAFVPVPDHPVAQRLDSLERSVRCLSRANPFADLGNLPFGRANTWNFGLSLTQTLFAGGRIAGGLRATEAGARGAAIGVDAATAELTLAVVEAFFDAALADRLVEIAEAALAQSDSTLAQTRLRREVGTAPEFDLLRAAVARDNLRPGVLQARASRDVAHLRLRQLADLPGSGPLALEAPLAADGYAIPPVLAALVARAPDTTTARRVTVRQADELVTAQRGLLQVARGEALPALALTSIYGRVAYPSAAVPSWNEFYTNWNLTVSLQVPLFTGGRLRAGRRVAEAALEEAELRRELTREGAALDARASLAALEAAQAEWEASTGTTSQAARALDIASVRFQEGISTQTELLDARLAFQQAEANRATAARNLVVARVRWALLPDLPLPSGASASAAPASAPRRTATPAAPATSPLGIP